MDRYLRVATDGSSSIRDTKSAWAWIAEDGRYKTGNLYDATNNQAELNAIEEVLKLNENLLIISDSDYSIRVLTNPKTKVKKNITTVNRIKEKIADREAKGLKTQFVWQASHTIRKNKVSTEIEVILNHLADTLCTKMRYVLAPSPSKTITKEGIQSSLRNNYNSADYIPFEMEIRNSNSEI